MSGATYHLCGNVSDEDDGSQREPSCLVAWSLGCSPHTSTHILGTLGQELVSPNMECVNTLINPLLKSRVSSYQITVSNPISCPSYSVSELSLRNGTRNFVSYADAVVLRDVSYSLAIFSLDYYLITIVFGLSGWRKNLS